MRTIDLAEVSRENGGCSVIAVAPVPEGEVSRYGIVGGAQVGSLGGAPAGPEEPGAVWEVSEFVEKPAPEDAPSRLFMVGRYLLAPGLMGLLETQGAGAGGEVQLTDALQRMLESSRVLALVCDPASGVDTGTPAAFAAAQAAALGA